jgi:putative intracellular protease/amidase
MEFKMTSPSQFASLATTLFVASVASFSTHAETRVSPNAAVATTVTDAPKVLLVVSSEGRDGGKTRPGFEMDEFAQAYLVLRANGIKIDVASPAGGAVEADKFDPKDDHNVALFADEHAQRLLRSTRRLADVVPGEHQAILIIGGKGAMFDLPKDAALTKLLGAQYDRGGVVAAVCHGPAVFANVKRADGRPLIAGKRVTGFTDEEEASFGKQWVKEYPFLIESKLREQGAIWEEAALMMPKTVVDGKLITGQNPFSTAQATEAIVRALGRTPTQRTIFKEEASMQLVQRWLSGDRDAVRAVLKAESTRYKTDLIAMLGVHQFKSAREDAARRQALSIMELALPHMSHPKLRLTIAEAHVALGNAKAARDVLNALIAEKPDFTEAKQALAALPS